MVQSAWMAFTLDLAFLNPYVRLDARMVGAQ
ncbi:hypothetical protein HME9302_02024 [Alteripontixanthobacter maritimus]|uniref:Uncharacterized protein n=1 Tax=Alteripontixanthobacter maritimus TaxID=2161824 RepID=A0A369QET9_9SPHN|nr:hypothetical protein HME9302_02024 [Alteripontixanthobacter maritimus]